MSPLSRDGRGASVFEIGRSHGVWRVTRDRAFYGDYPVRQSAVDAAEAAARLPLGRASPADIHIDEHTA